MPGRLDMLARVGLSPRCRVGAFMPDGGDPVKGWLAGFPGTGAASEAIEYCAKATVLQSLCHAGAKHINSSGARSGRGAALF